MNTAFTMMVLFRNSLMPIADAMYFLLSVLSAGDLDNFKRASIFYSVLKLFIGLAIAALIA